MSSFDSERSTTDSYDYDQDCDSKQTLAEGIVYILSMLIKQNQKLQRYDRIIRRQKNNFFSALEKPEISLVDYLKRIMHYTKAEESTYINSLIYIDRICLVSSIVITEYNIHRLLFASIILSIKYNEDRYYENNYYAQIAGVSKGELSALEYEFLTMIDFSLFIEEKEYLKYFNCLKKVNTKAKDA